MVEPGGDPAGPAWNDSGWLKVKPGAWEMQLPQERDEAVYPVTLWYRTRFDADHLPQNLRVLIDGFSGTAYAMYVNGTEVKDRGTRSALDAEIKEVDVHAFVRQGTNVIAVRLTVNRRTDGILDPLKIIGDFALASNGAGYTMTSRGTTQTVGDWTSKGYPFFSGTGAYSVDVDIPERYVGGKLFLEVECGEDVLEVSVNGGPVHVQPWAPYRIDVSSLVHAGSNQFTIKVTNTLINILEGVQHRSGLLEAPRLVHAHRYELTVQ
jgi:hypothetical protein